MRYTVCPPRASLTVHIELSMVILSDGVLILNVGTSQLVDCWERMKRERGGGEGECTSRMGRSLGSNKCHSSLSLVVIQSE